VDRQCRLSALSGHFLLSVNEIGDREAYPENGEHQSPENDLEDKDNGANDNGNDESVKEEECEHDDIFLRVNNYVC
jgi:hypothetical protein